MMKMKKMILAFAACALVGAAAFAEENAGNEANQDNVFSRFFSAIQPEVGLKLVQAIGAGSTWSDDISGKSGANFGGGVTLLGRMSAGTKSVRYMNQIEVSLILNNGVGNTFTNLFDSSDTETFLGVTTIDIPVLFGVDILAGERVTLTPYIGPYISIPVAGTLTVAGNGNKLSCAGVTFGGTAGFSAGFKAGAGSIVMDGRYVFDFMPTKMRFDGESTELYRRAGIQGSIGYQMKL